MSLYRFSILAIGLLALVMLMPNVAAAQRRRIVQEITVQAKWDYDALFGQRGHVGMRGFININNDRQLDLISNIGSRADFAAIEQDGTVLWRTTLNTTKEKLAYYPKFLPDKGLMIYGGRANNKVYGVNTADGTLRWDYTTNGALGALEHADIGLVVGSSQEVAVLDYDTGTVKFPTIQINQHEQALGAGDLDGDGHDELVLNNNSGLIEARETNGDLLFSIQSGHSHVDLHSIGDIDPDHPGNELLTVIDADGSTGSEGDEIVTLDAVGNQLNKFTTAQGGANLAVGDILPDLPGKEIAFGLEGTNTVGLLDGSLNPLFSRQITTAGNGAGQTALADVNGDGTLEILINTGENPDAGFSILNAQGNILDTVLGMGWDFDPINTKSNAAIGAKRFTDVDGDGRDEIYASRLGANNRSGHEVLFLLGNIPEPSSASILALASLTLLHRRPRHRHN